jgi:hypothetical protein
MQHGIFFCTTSASTDSKLLPSSTHQSRTPYCLETRMDHMTQKDAARYIAQANFVVEERRDHITITYGRSGDGSDVSYFVLIRDAKLSTQFLFVDTGFAHAGKRLYALSGA